MVNNLVFNLHAPNELSVSDHPVARGVVIGSCFAESMAYHAPKAIENIKCEFVTYNFVSDTPAISCPIGDYDFQLIMLPLRSVMPETMFMNLRWDDIEGYEKCFQYSLDVLKMMLNGSLIHNETSGITSFVADFLAPQSNSMGRLLPKNDIRNPVEYVRRLNDYLYDYTSQRSNVYSLSVDQLASFFGRRYVQDDFIYANSHGAFITDWDWQYDQHRLHPPVPVVQTIDAKSIDFILSIWIEIKVMLRTLAQKDSVKLVICDLDDTLWRGVPVENPDYGSEITEGWPLGLIEALTILKRRGVLLAIASKNDESKIREIWPRVIGPRLPLEDFASVKINWNPKSENIAQILKETSLLASNAVFIDDNPVEREVALLSHPGIRVLGSDLYRIRRILLWSSETQVAAITSESARRTEMVRSQIERDQSRATMSRADFLQTLGIKVEMQTIARMDHPQFARCLELLNKTNQFNTTGKRWSREEINEFFRHGGSIDALSVTDKFTDYGLVALALVSGNRILQYAMSCRVLGLDVEIYFLATLATRIAPEGGAVSQIVETSANALCRDLFARCGWTEADGQWVSVTPYRLPDHIRNISQPDASSAGHQAPAASEVMVG